MKSANSSKNQIFRQGKESFPYACTLTLIINKKYFIKFLCLQLFPFYTNTFKEKFIVIFADIFIAVPCDAAADGKIVLLLFSMKMG